MTTVFAKRRLSGPVLKRRTVSRFEKLIVYNENINLRGVPEEAYRYTFGYKN
jgi:predicted helicase